MASEEARRPILASVSGGDTVEVILDHRGRQYTGECDAADADGLPAAAAAATLRALTALAPSDVEFRLDWCGVLEPGRALAPTVVVLATMTVGREPVTLAGAALVRQDVQVAAVRAALDAVNRRIEVLGI